MGNGDEEFGEGFDVAGVAEVGVGEAVFLEYGEG